MAQRIVELHQQSAMPPFNPLKKLSRINLKHRVLAISVNGLTSKPYTGDESDLTYWPKESYVESSYVPRIPNNMFHSQENENNDSKTPEQSTFVTKSSIKCQLQTLSEIFKSVDVEQSTDNETSKSSLEEGSGIKHSPSPVQVGSSQEKILSVESCGTTLRQEQQLLPLQFDQSSYNKYLMSNGSLQQTTPTKLDPLRSYIPKGQQSPFDHCYDGTKCVVSQHPETETMDKPQNQSNCNAALLVSNEVVVESSELIDFSKTAPVDSQIKLQSSQSTEIPADIKNTRIPFSDIIPEEITPWQEYQLQLQPIQFTDTQDCLSEDYTAWNELLREMLNSELDSCEVTLPVEYETFHITEMESSRVQVEPVKTTKNANKDMIESNVLIAPPKKYIYAGAVPKNPRKNSKQTSKSRPKIGSTRLNLQSQQKSRNVKPVQQDHKPHPLAKKTVTFDTKLTPLKRKLKENILPIVPSKKPLLQDPNEVQITMHDKTFCLQNVSIERVTIVRGIEKKETVRNLKFETPWEPNANKMTFSDCMNTLLSNNIKVFKIPKSPNKYSKLEKNHVRVC